MQAQLREAAPLLGLAEIPAPQRSPQVVLLWLGKEGGSLLGRASLSAVPLVTLRSSSSVSLQQVCLPQCTGHRTKTSFGGIVSFSYPTQLQGPSFDRSMDSEALTGHQVSSLVCHSSSCLFQAWTRKPLLPLLGPWLFSFL